MPGVKVFCCKSCLVEKVPLDCDISTSKYSCLGLSGYPASSFFFCCFGFFQKWGCKFLFSFCPKVQVPQLNVETVSGKFCLLVCLFVCLFVFFHALCFFPP